MRVRVWLTSAYHRDTGALTDAEAVAQSTMWTYEGSLLPHMGRAVGWLYLEDVTVRYDGPGTRPTREPASDVLLPPSVITLVEVVDDDRARRCPVARGQECDDPKCATGCCEGVM